MSDQTLGILIWLPLLTGGLAGAVVNVAYHYLREVRSRPVLKIESTNAPRRIGGANDPDQNEVYMKFRVQNTRRRTVARNCRAYLVGVHEVRGTEIMSANDLILDSVQLTWEGGSYDPKDIPSGHLQYGTHSQYGDIVHFSKREGEAGWWFHTKPHSRHIEHIGKLQFTILVSGDDITPAIALIDIDYRGDWKGVGPVDVGRVLTLRRRFSDGQYRAAN